MTRAAILDVDGTLVDTNYHHVIAWYRAFRRHDLDPAVWRIHRHVGMGGDKMVAAIAGDEAEAELGDAIREAEKELYMEMIDEVRPLGGARGLMEALRARVDRVVLASSAKEDEVEHYVDLLEARELAHSWTSSADVDETKPSPDLVETALRKSGADEALMIGDTTWDCLAAGRAGVPAVAVLTGGFGADELREAGAVEVFETLDDIRGALDRLPVVGRPL
jgi:HAD superfamily hydrolase (TIGR01549 family)